MDELFDRATTRERTIWPSFVYAGPFDADVTGMRKTIFGLYAMSYRHGHASLDEITSEELQRLLEQYEAAMSELDAQEQALVLDMASKRYIDAIDRAIKQAALTTKSKNLDAKEIEIGYKEDALDVDREELQTKRNQIQLAKDKAEVAIEELETRIELESLEQQYVEVDKSKRQLEHQRAQLSVLESVIKGIDIQIAINEAALQTAEISADKSKLQADIATIESQIARAGLIEKEIEVDEAEIDAIEHDLTEMREAKLGPVGLHEKRKEILEEEKGELEKYDERLDVLYTEEDQELTNKENAVKDRLKDKDTEAAARLDIRIDDVDQDREFSETKKIHRISIANERAKIPAKRASAQKKTSSAAIAAAEKIASANIVNTLTHQIAKA
jgi:hypothetical protein